MKRIRVLVVDDSPLMRELLTTIFRRSEDLEVVGTASDPLRAAEAIARLRPDVMTLDVEMPRQDGVSFLEEIMRTRPMPVVMISSLTQRGSQLAMRALELGAVDVVEKPRIDIAAGTAEMADEILNRVRAAARARVQPRRTPATEPSAQARPRATKPSLSFRGTDSVVAIGASTGGTEALVEVFSAFPPDLPGVLVVQHMPARFTATFAKRLDGLSRVRVCEAADGMPVLPGHALIAPGGLQMRLVRSGARFLVRVTDEPPVNLHRPSVDVLFESCATSAGASAVGVILTGMGADGAAGLLSMRRAGATTIAQDEASCVVFGMPKEAIACGAAQEILPLDRIAPAVARTARAATLS